MVLSGGTKPAQKVGRFIILRALECKLYWQMARADVFARSSLLLTQCFVKVVIICIQQVLLLSRIVADLFLNNIAVG